MARLLLQSLLAHGNKTAMKISTFINLKINVYHDINGLRSVPGDSNDKNVAAMLVELTIDINEESFVVVLQHGGNDVTCKGSLTALLLKHTIGKRKPKYISAPILRDIGARPPYKTLYLKICHVCTGALRLCATSY